MSEAKPVPRIDLVYGPDDAPRSTRDRILYSLQWVFIMFYPVVWGYSIVGINVGFTPEELSGYMARVVLMIGVSTLIQVMAGHKLSMVSGPNIIPSLAIVAAFSLGGKELALMSFNAYIIAGLVVAVMGGLGWISQIGKVWTPLALGAMVMMVGLVTSTVGIGLIAEAGASWPFAVGIGLALLCGWISIQGRGLLATVPVLVVIVIGYVIFIVTGKFNWDLVNTMPVFSVPQLFPYGFEMPPIQLILTMIIVNLFSAVNLYGNVSGYAGIMGQRVTPLQEKRYFTVFGLAEGSACSILGVPANVAYGENLGLVLLTRIASRYFIIIASLAFIALSFFGKFGGMMAAMPKEVAGAVLLGVASTLIGIGANIWHQNKQYETREIFITGFAVFFAYGIANLPGIFFDALPDIASMLLKNAVITVIIAVIVLEQMVFRARKAGAEKLPAAPGTSDAMLPLATLDESKN
jgi:NCS2 family nucleobase:cation symporter-2